MQQRLSKEEIPKFVLAGNATVTLESGTSGRHFTYRIKRHDEQDVYFVHLLRGPDNESDYRYIGAYYPNRNYFHVAKMWQAIKKDMYPPSVRAIQFMFDTLNNVHDNLHVYHEGKCGKCGRTLTTPESIRAGYGPECMKVVNKS